MSRIRRFFDEWRPSAVTLGAPTFPLLILFALNAVDELDRTAFSVLLPDIRDHFDISNARILSIVALASVVALLIEIPLSFYCDRHNRVRIAIFGAALWGLFSIGTGLSISVGMLVLMRIGAGTGRAIVTPTHNGLLSDWYSPEARLKVFSFHRLANSVGQIAGPALGGILAYAFGWRSPFFILAIPTLIIVVLALRLKEPVRGMQERLAAGADEETALAQDTHESVWSTMKVLGRVPTLRRIWYAVPFLAVALFGIPNLLSLVYDDVFGLNALERGFIAAGIEPLQLIGVIVAVPHVGRISATRPEFLLRFIAVVGVFDGLMLVVLGYAPNVVVAVCAHALIAATIGTLTPAFFVMLSLVSPPRCRSAAFSTISLFGIPGIVVFLPLIGYLSDTFGAQASLLTLVPVSVMAGWMLSRAAPFVAADIESVRLESLARVTPSPTTS